MENFLNIEFVLTVGHDFKVWPSAFAEGDSSKVSRDQLPIHKASIEWRASVRVDVSYSFTSHLSILIHLPKYAAAILDTCKTYIYLKNDILLKQKTRHVKTVNIQNMWMFNQLTGLNNQHSPQRLFSLYWPRNTKHPSPSNSWAGPLSSPSTYVPYRMPPSSFVYMPWPCKASSTKYPSRVLQERTINSLFDLYSISDIQKECLPYLAIKLFSNWNYPTCWTCCDFCSLWLYWFMTLSAGQQQQSGKKPSSHPIKKDDTMPTSRKICPYFTTWTHFSWNIFLTVYFYTYIMKDKKALSNIYRREKRGRKICLRKPSCWTLSTFENSNPFFIHNNCIQVCLRNMCKQLVYPVNNSTL